MPWKKSGCSPTNVLAQGPLYGHLWCVKIPDYLSSQPIFLCNGNCLPKFIAHISARCTSTFSGQKRAEFTPKLGQMEPALTLLCLETFDGCKFQNLLSREAVCFNPTACPWGSLRNSHLLWANQPCQEIKSSFKELLPCLTSTENQWNLSSLI